jgi:hypothetical protein
MAAIWTILNTMLFSTVMISDAALSALVYVPPSSSSLPHPTSLALQTLHTLSHLSFVITKFGGVTTTSTSSFKELKKIFYTALDLSAADDEGQEAGALVRNLASGEVAQKTNMTKISRSLLP